MANFLARATATFVILAIVGQGSAQAPAPGPGPQYATIAAAARANPNVTLTLAAAQAIGLSSALSDPNSAYTVFAPTNAAIISAATAQGTTPQQLLAYSGLPSILRYHIVPQPALSSQLTSGQTLPTLLGPNVTISISNGVVKIIGATNNATVIVPDITAGRSVVHVIDTLLLPANLTVRSPASAPDLALAQQTASTLAPAAASGGRKSMM